MLDEPSSILDLFFFFLTQPEEGTEAQNDLLVYSMIIMLYYIIYSI